MHVALDAMGGDFAPGPIVAGACEAVGDHPDLTVVLVGDRERIEAELAKAARRAPRPPADRPRQPDRSAWMKSRSRPCRKKRDNSISRCWGLMAAGEVKAVVSAGNTGAMVASALFNAKMFLPGVRRPGIAAIFPSHQGPIVIIDVGANMNAKAEDLYQYGIMGAIYAETILGVTSPRIGLLNVGTEDEKGNELTRSTRDLFQDSPWAARFVGNIEGRDIHEGHVRVVICDGFVGNVLLKAGEGAVEFLFATLREELARLMPDLPGDAGHQIAAQPETAQDAGSSTRNSAAPRFWEFAAPASSATAPRAHGRSRTPCGSPARWPKTAWATASSNSWPGHSPAIGRATCRCRRRRLGLNPRARRPAPG